jgi:putative DNA primase/helicase
MTMSAAGIAHQLRAMRQGRNWRVPFCPCGCGYALSFCDGADGRLLVHCYGGCDFNEIMLALVEYGLLDGEEGDPSSPPGDHFVTFRNDADQRRRKIQQAREIYASGAWDERIAVYLRARGIGLTSPILKFHEQAPHRLGARLPAMLAPVVDIDGEQIGVHMTYLRRDGAGKADLPKEFQRECRGVIHGGAIRLMPFDPKVELVISEGLETGLAAAELFALPCWSAVYAGGLKTTELPIDVRRIIIAADNDVSGAGQRNALAAYDRWIAEGRSVRIKCPPNAGDDFNDVLIERRTDARR